VVLTLALVLAGCGDSPRHTAAPVDSTSSSPSTSLATVSPPSPSASTPPPAPQPSAGNPGGRAIVPAEARAVDTSKPTRVIGNGTPASCTAEAVTAAVAAGGIVTFSCGPDPITITMKATAKVRNANARLV